MLERRFRPRKPFRPYGPERCDEIVGFIRGYRGRPALISRKELPVSIEAPADRCQRFTAPALIGGNDLEEIFAASVGPHQRPLTLRHRDRKPGIVIPGEFTAEIIISILIERRNREGRSVHE